MHVPIIFMYLPPLSLWHFIKHLPPSPSLLLISSLLSFDLEIEIGNAEMPCKIRKRGFPTGSSSSFANNKLSQFLVEKNENEKCSNSLDRSSCKEEELVTMALRKPGGDDQVNEVFEKSIVDRSRNKSRSSPRRVSAPEGKGLCGETKNDGHSMLKPIHGLDEIKHSLTVSKDLFKLLTRVWTANSNHNHHHPTTISLASILNHELNKARSHVNKLIQEQRSNNTITCESKEQDKIRVAVETIARELETERKLRRQTERMNKKLGRELANTKSFLDKAIKKAESEKQAMEILEQLCEKMAVSIEEDRVELEKLKKESEKVREEMEEEREMLRVADMLREERVQMKLIDAKYEYEDKDKQMNILVHDLEELLEADNGIDHLKRSPSVLSWYQSTVKNKGGDENTTKEKTTIRSLWYENKENDKGKVVNDENVLGDDSKGLSWYENMGEVVNDELANTNNEVIGRNSDCIELEFGLDMKNGSEDLNECSEDRVLGFSCSSTMKEYEDEMERYKMIKDLRDRIVSGGSDLSRDTIEYGSYM